MPLSDIGDEYETPPELVTELAAEFGAFDLDPAARACNAKAPQFFDQAVDGLKQPWFGNVFLNPPYGGPGRARVLDAWVAKAAAESESNGIRVVALLPAWTDTDWWHDVLWPRVREGLAELRFHRRRIHFLTPSGHRVRPIRASCTVIFDAAKGR